MRHFYVCTFLVVLGWAASPALGQGLYGAPEMLPLAPASPEIASPPSGYVSMPAGYAGTQPAYPQAQYPQAQYPQAQYPQAQYPQAQYPQIQPAPRGVYGPVPMTARTASSGQASPMFDGPDYGSNGSACGPGCQSFGAACGFENAPCFQPNPCFQPKWYASAAGLFLTRDKANGVWVTDDPMRTTDADVGWRGGYDVKIGAYLGPCNNWSIEAGYWTIDRFNGFADMSLLPFSTVSTPLIVSNIEFAGVNGVYFFDNAAEHRVWRQDRVQSAEASLVYRFQGGAPCRSSPFDVSVLAGARYFGFDENLTFGSLANGGSWGGNGGYDEAYLNDRISNNLIGFQFGCDAGYRVVRTVRLYVSPRLGFYDNHIRARFDALRGDGTRATPTPASGVVGSYPVSADKDVFSFLGQIDAGLDWEFSPHWTVFLGYRLVAATGIGLADHQIPADVVDVSALGDIKHNGNLLVHGALAGIKVAF